VRFECRAEQASAVFLAGSFNDWSESATPMTHGENGVWYASLDLPPGRHEYKFIIDGQWCCSPELLPDPTRASCVPNSFGSMNFAIDAGPDET
jgi:1,4-alpha-glucan branching enzyme